MLWIKSRIEKLPVREPFYTLIAAAIVMILSYTAKVEDWSHTDPKGSLLTGQALMEHGSPDLRPYEDQMVDFYWQLIRGEDTLYYAYPIGTTLLHLPGIWIANKCGFDMANPFMEAELNRLFAAISLAIITFLTVALFRRRCSYPLSVFFALTLVLGSGIFSTLGLALWNLNYSVVSALAIIVMLDNQRLRQMPRTGWLIGLCLLTGFICRPSFALFVLAVFVYLACFNRAQLLRAAGLSAVLLGVYLLFHHAMLGRFTNSLYKVSAFSLKLEILPNLLGLFISPSRGLFVFSPFLLLTVFGLFRYGKQWRADPWLVCVTLWFPLLLVFISGWGMWWGGGGFGNRLVVETMPGWIFMSAVFWPLLWNEARPGLRQGVRIILPLLAVFTFWIHVLQAGNNQQTVTWHQHPNKDQFPEYFWNPRFPQWLASKKQVRAMDAWHEARQVDQAPNAKGP